MAHNDIEVEIKVSVSPEDFLRIKERLGRTAKFVKVSEQSDEYFDLANRSFLSVEYPSEWISIRKRGNKSILNYKRFHPPNTLVFTHCDEYDVEISDPEKLAKIFSLIDLKSLVIVDKIREVYNYNDEIEIDMDFIKELGYFIEIEALKDFGGVEKTRERIIEFAYELGIDISNKVNRGYPYLLMKKRGFLK
jgi:predicted adenylyl cyclase CyaB